MLDLEPYKRRVDAAGKDHAPALSVACGRELIAEVERLRSEADTLVEIIEAASRENERLQGVINDALQIQNNLDS